jgi:hypothetical protein
LKSVTVSYIEYRQSHFAQRKLSACQIFFSFTPIFIKKIKEMDNISLYEADKKEVLRIVYAVRTLFQKNNPSLH